MRFLPLDEAKQFDGARLVTVAGVPSPWSEAAKAILTVKKIPFVGVRLSPGDAALAEWTGTHNAPVLMVDGEAPRTGWAEILLLAEQLSPSPPLLPADPAERALAFGIAHEICGEMGLGWARRLEGIAAALDEGSDTGFPEPVARYLAGKYGYRPGCGAAARQRVVDVLTLLDTRLRAQEVEGSPYYLGGTLSAVDLYAATFMAIVAPLAPEQCPMPDALRTGFTASDPDTLAAITLRLLAHRDRIYAEHLELPITL